MGGGMQQGMPRGMPQGMPGAGQAVASATNVGGLNAKLALQMMMGRSSMQVARPNLPESPPVSGPPESAQI